MLLPMRCASITLQMDIRQPLIAQFHFRGVGKLNLIRHREYQTPPLNMCAPLQSTQDAIRDDQRPTELAMMDLRVWLLSIARNLVDLFCMFHRHLRPAINHLVFDETELDKN